PRTAEHAGLGSRRRVPCVPGDRLPRTRPTGYTVNTAAVGLPTKRRGHYPILGVIAGVYLAGPVGDVLALSPYYGIETVLPVVLAGILAFLSVRSPRSARVTLGLVLGGLIGVLIRHVSMSPDEPLTNMWMAAGAAVGLLTGLLSERQTRLRY